MNSYNSSLTNTYSDRHPAPLSRNEHTAVSKENRPVSESVREGQQLRGEIINRTTTDITIRLSNGQTLQARLDVSVPLSIGQTASFEVTHADPALISLRILQDESAFAQNALIQKALAAAELPVTSRNAELVNTLLQHNLPINKESILSLIRQSNAYPNADLNTLALLTQHKLPVTQATLTQFEAYQNYEHQILPQLTNLAHSLSELTSSSDASASELTRTLQNFLHPTSGLTIPYPEDLSPIAQASVNTVADSQHTFQAAHSPLTEAAAPLIAETLNPETLTGAARNQTTDFTAPATHPPVQNQAFPLTDSYTEVASTVPHAPANTATDPQASFQAAQNPLAEAAEPQASVTLSAESLTSPPTTLELPAAQQSAPSETSLYSPLQDNFVQQLLTRWTLSPAELTNPDKVKEFYQQLRNDLAELHSALTSEDAGHSAHQQEVLDSPLERLVSDTASATAQLQDNLEFMNMLNRIFPYVQLPIRFSDKTTHGELYVYTKKEKLRHESGSISVLLHLDMEALGPTDIYLSLTGNSLNSRFYLNAPEQETLFTEHLPELKEALAGKGFDTSFELVSRKQEEDPVREFLHHHDSSGLSRFTFDCRA